MAKTADCPIDFEIKAGDLPTWTEPAGEPIEPARREELLDEIARYYSNGLTAGIVGMDGVFLRDRSTYKFSLQIHPEPSRYYEVGRFWRSR